MTIPAIFNSKKLFLKVNGLSDTTNHTRNLIFQEIYSRSLSALLNLDKINQGDQGCRSEFRAFENQIIIKDDRIVFSSISLEMVLNEISPLLATLRLLQNLTLSFLTAVGEKGLPKSLNDFCSKQHKYNIESNAKKLITNYWQTNGQILKHYRDVDQHYTWLLNRYFIQVKPEVKLIVELPDNPEVKSAQKFTYQSKINAIDFLRTSFYELHDLYEQLAVLYGANDKLHEWNINFAQFGDLTTISERTFGIFIQNLFVLNPDNSLTQQMEAYAMQQTEEGIIGITKYLPSEKL